MWHQNAASFSCTFLREGFSLSPCLDAQSFQDFTGRSTMPSRGPPPPFDHPRLRLAHLHEVSPPGYCEDFLRDTSGLQLFAPIKMRVPICGSKEIIYVGDPCLLPPLQRAALAQLSCRALSSRHAPSSGGAGAPERKPFGSPAPILLAATLFALHYAYNSVCAGSQSCWGHVSPRVSGRGCQCSRDQEQVHFSLQLKRVHFRPSSAAAR
jgi:hypothetical protein|uniref:Uncharacterized protein n=1 Tax=Eutreptiella gymnastica TaxID=73025 RepID=A0A7S4FZK2_9EUGL|mmetsp:Transcript_58379/g.96800  ORF Transcript_58379/g.96800 Transcript_58379/m.96800 type:complete len:209 (+) Transcript_58379:1123-1749(+)